MRFKLSVLLLSFFPLAILAQQKDTITTRGLQEVEISANIKPSSTTSSTPLQVFTADQMMQQGVHSVSDAVKRFGGVVFKDYGGLGGLKTISVRGMGAEYTAINYDGLMINNLQSGQVDINRFSLDNVSMLSLSIGQSDDIFQSAKTFSAAGILSLQTQKPTFDKGNYKIHSRISTGSFGHFEPTLNYAYKLSNKVSLATHFNWQRADGKYPFTSNNNEDRKRKNGDTNILRTEVNLYTQLSKTDLLDIKFYYFDSERGLPGWVIYDYDNAKERLWDKNAFAQIAYNKHINEKWKFKSLAKYDFNYSKYQNDLTGDYIRNKYKQHEVYWSNSILYNITSNISATFSEDLIYNNLRSKFSSFDSSKKEPDRYSSFTALATQYKTERISITASGLSTLVNETSKGNSKKDNYKRVSPAVSLSYKLFDETDLRVRASYKHIYRIPTFSELYYVATSKSLKPESASQYNLGITWLSNIKKTPIEYIKLSLDAYYNDVKDKIVIQPTPYLPVSYNLEKVDMQGINVNIATNIKVTDAISLDLSGTYNYLQARDMSRKTSNGAENPTYKHQIAYTPKHSGSASLTINNPWVSATYTALFSDTRYATRENLKKYEIDSYADHSFTLFKEMKLHQNQFYASGTITNIWNKNYEVIKDYPMPGRAFRVTVGYKF